jgi:predicted O-linked N-acetylglucosamine transferase (SPINDLY family)
MSVAPPRELMRCTQLLREGKLAECKVSLMQLLARFPGDVPVMRVAVQCLGELGEHHAALYQAKRLLAMNPRDAGIVMSVARLHARVGEMDPALRGMDEAGKLGLVEAMIEAAEMRLGSGRVVEGLRTLESQRDLMRRAAAANANAAAVIARCALVEAQLQLALGDVAACLTACERVQAAEPDVAIAIRALQANCTNYLADVSIADSYAAHRRFGEVVEAIYSAPEQNVAGVVRDANRAIRIGVVSPDLRTHSVACFAEPMLRQLFSHRDQFDVCVYHIAGVEDEVTKRLRAFARVWRHMPYQGPAEIASTFVADGVDIVIELAGLTNTLGVCALAHRPAPIAVTYVGYPNTCGTSRIDYRVVDSMTDLVDAEGGADRATAVEQLVRIDPCFLCYSPPGDAPDVAERVVGSGEIVFASFNAVQKINKPLAELWRDVLDATPGSRLLLKANGLREADAVTTVAKRLAAWGLPMERVELVGATRTRAEHLAMYAQVDVALDTYPYHGTTTTCEALWMGVPVVVLAGDRHASRVGISLLQAVGRREMVAQTRAEYVQIASSLAKNASKLQKIRADLRRNVSESPLCDEVAFGERLRSNLRDMWRNWCERAKES